MATAKTQSKTRKRKTPFNTGAIIKGILHLIFTGILIFSAYHVVHLVQSIPNLTSTGQVVGIVFMVLQEVLLEIILISFLAGEMEDASYFVGGVIFILGFAAMIGNVMADMEYGAEWAIYYASWSVPVTPFAVSIASLFFFLSLPRVQHEIRSKFADKKSERTTRENEIANKEAEEEATALLNEIANETYRDYLLSEDAKEMQRKLAEQRAEADLRRVHGLTPELIATSSGDGQASKK